MIYRLATGTRSQAAKHILSGVMVLAITVGFPVAAAWLNHENLTLNPRPIAQTNKKGAVLGESTNKSTSDGSDDNTMHVSSAPTPHPISVKPWKQPTKASTTTTTATVPVPATPVTSTQNSQPAPTAAVTTPSTSGSSAPTNPSVGLEVNVLDTTLNVGVSPSGADANLGL